MKLTFSQVCFAFLALLFLSAHSSLAHATPDIPVRTFFPGDGSAQITVEIDPRSFDADPNLCPSMNGSALNALSPEQKNDLKKKAGELTSRCVEFFLEPIGRLKPELAFDFTAKGGTPAAPTEEIVVLTGRCETPLAMGLTGWRVRSTPENKLSVVFQNVIRGEAHPRIAVLFPGESSFVLDLTGLTPASQPKAQADAVSTQKSAGDGWSTLGYFLRHGFLHVLPQGLDHILFVLGLFLLSRNWRPMLAQVTMFTLAHSVTLALATLGWIHAPASVIEPVISASIAAVALENIWRPSYSRWRLALVFGFGLVHGLGFASGLKDYHLSSTSLLSSLIGFNLGVESAQIAVLAIALLLTSWLREPALYRNWIVLPGSAAIALAGAWWTVERVFLG
jgi:hydrogenase/urease accessory protein HupE